MDLLLSILASLVTIGNNPALITAIGGAAAAKFAPILGLVSTLAQAGTQGYAELKTLDAQLKAIVATGNVPTAEDWAGWDARHQAAKARLQA